MQSVALRCGSLYGEHWHEGCRSGLACCPVHSPLGGRGIVTWCMGHQGMCAALPLLHLPHPPPGVCRYYTGAMYWNLGPVFYHLVWQMLPCIPWMILMRFLLPKHSAQLYVHIVLLQLCHLSFMLVSNITGFEYNTDSQLFLLGIVVPLAKELSGFPIRFVVRSLESLDRQDKSTASFDGQVIKKRNENGWIMLLFHWRDQVRLFVL